MMEEQKTTTPKGNKADLHKSTHAGLKLNGRLAAPHGLAPMLISNVSSRTVDGHVPPDFKKGIVYRRGLSNGK